MVHHQIGRRPFYEARYREAAAEFEWTRYLHRSTGQREHCEDVAQTCQTGPGQSQGTGQQKAVTAGERVGACGALRCA
ncbi:hypothetical protein [Arthrobacter sp. FW306-04-A]|uniref:hypothetical protein n=1 Tax=Arthrobacter sp. FW306-04-A TaxID=2879619 RepID=UPI0037BEE44C|nr:hypothetical protein LFT43_08660 [Arthrobacter sp. FW306-04-A]